MSILPYPGLRPFQEDEADIFFGRENHVDEILGRLEQKEHFLAVVGLSACGKSSLVRAGVLPALRLGFLVQAGIRWSIAHIHPGTDPMMNLATALIQSEDFAPEEDEDPYAVDFLVTTLRKGPLGVIEWLDERGFPKRNNLLILVDQFEELFRFHETVGFDEVDAFIQLLLTSSAERPNVYVIITLRSEYVGECALFDGLPEALNANQYLTPRLSREMLREAIVGPANVFGGRIEPTLVTHLLNDMGNDPDQLPILQHILKRMWMIKRETSTNFTDGLRGLQLTLADYEQVGGLERALSRHANETFQVLNGRQKSLASVLFRTLTERTSNGLYIRRPVRLADAAHLARTDNEEIAEIVEVFRKTDRCFLMPPAEIDLQPGTWVDIAHESLIRKWGRLKRWANEEAASASHYRHLEATALRWKAGNAALWSSPDLEYAMAWKKELEHHLSLDWREDRDSFALWARRYGDNFQDAAEFLQASEDKRREDERRQELDLIKRTRWLFESQMTEATLWMQLQNYAEALKLFTKTRKLDEQILHELRYSRNMMEWFAETMNLPSGEPFLRRGEEICHLAISADGNLFAIAGNASDVEIIQSESGLPCNTLKCDTNVLWISFHPRISNFLIIGENRQVSMWNVRTTEKIRKWHMPFSVSAFALSHDGTLLATSLRNHTIHLWRTDEQNEPVVFERTPSPVRAVTFSGDDELLICGSVDGSIITRSTKTGIVFSTIENNTAGIETLCCHPDTAVVAVNDRNNNICLFDIESSQPMGTLRGHGRRITSIEFLNNSRYIMSGSEDRTLRIWDICSGTIRKVLQIHNSTATGIVQKADRVYVATGSGVVLRLESVKSSLNQNVRILDVPNFPTSCAVDPSASVIAVGFKEGELAVYRLPEFELIWHKPEAHVDDIINRIVFSPDGKNLATAGANQLLRLWDADSGYLKQSAEVEDQDGLHSIVFSPSGEVVAGACYNGQIVLWSMGHNRPSFHDAHETRLFSVDFDENEQHLLSAGEDGTVRIWSYSDSGPLQAKILFESSKSISWASFSPDTKRVACTGRDKKIHLLRLKDGAEAFSLSAHTSEIVRAEFGMQGNQLVTLGQDATIRFWDLRKHKELFALELPVPKDELEEHAFWDFCMCSLPKHKSGDCWISVPLPSRKVALYHLPGINQ